MSILVSCTSVFVSSTGRRQSEGSKGSSQLTISFARPTKSYAWSLVTSCLPTIALPSWTKEFLAFLRFWNPSQSRLSSLSDLFARTLRSMSNCSPTDGSLR
jgi:hypothetical protein